MIAGGILKISVLERLPAFVWRNPKGLFLLDKEGKNSNVVSATKSYLLADHTPKDG